MAMQHVYGWETDLPLLVHAAELQIFAHAVMLLRFEPRTERHPPRSREMAPRTSAARSRNRCRAAPTLHSRPI